MARKGPTPKTGDKRSLSVTVKAEVAEVPQPPVGLLRRHRDLWATFWTSDVARAIDPPSDLPVVERWITTLDELERAQTELRKMKSKFTTGSQGQLILHPITGYIDKLATRLAKLERTLGIGPLNKASLGLTVGQAQITMAELNDAVRARSAEPPDAEMIALMAEFAE